MSSCVLEKKRNDHVLLFQDKLFLFRVCYRNTNITDVNIRRTLRIVACILYDARRLVFICRTVWARKRIL